MTIPTSLALKLKQFKTGKPIKMTARQKLDLKKYYQTEYRYSIDTDCNDCISKAMDKIVKTKKI